MTRREPDLDMAVRIRAEELRFECVPRVSVSARADAAAAARSGSIREGLPESVEPGVVYRDVEVAWRASAWLQGD